LTNPNNSIFEILTAKTQVEGEKRSCFKDYKIPVQGIKKNLTADYGTMNIKVGNFSFPIFHRGLIEYFFMMI